MFGNKTGRLTPSGAPWKPAANKAVSGCSLRSVDPLCCSSEGHVWEALLRFEPSIIRSPDRCFHLLSCSAVSQSPSSPPLPPLLHLLISTSSIFWHFRRRCCCSTEPKQPLGSLTAGGAAEVSWFIQDPEGNQNRDWEHDRNVGKLCDQCGAVGTSDTGPLVYFPPPNLDYQDRLNQMNSELID